MFSVLQMFMIFISYIMYKLLKIFLAKGSIYHFSLNYFQLIFLFLVICYNFFINKIICSEKPSGSVGFIVGINFCRFKLISSKYYTTIFIYSIICSGRPPGTICVSSGTIDSFIFLQNNPSYIFLPSICF